MRVISSYKSFAAATVTASVITSLLVAPYSYAAEAKRTCMSGKTKVTAKVTYVYPTLSGSGTKWEHANVSIPKGKLEYRIYTASKSFDTGNKKDSDRGAGAVINKVDTTLVVLGGKIGDGKAKCKISFSNGK